MSTRILTLLTLGVLAFSSLCAQAQTGSISGHLSDEAGVALPHIRVALLGTSTATISDNQGDYRFRDVPAGAVTLQIAERGFKPEQRLLSLNNGQSLRADVTLLQDQTTVNVVESLREYHVSETSLATRIPERLLDVPQSVQVYPNQLIEDRAILEGNELFRNISGINQSAYSAMTFRGFTQREILYNGSRGNPFGSLEGDVSNSGFSTSQIRLTNIQRVEVLKGPTSALYGSGDAGGLINYVTKQPKEEMDLDVQYRGGSYAQKFGNADFSRPLGTRVFSRGAFFYEDRDTFRNNTSNQNLDAIANLLYKPSERHTFAAEGEYIGQILRGQRLRGVPVDSTGRFLTATRWTANEPSDRTKLVGRVLQLRGEDKLPGGWDLNYVFRDLGYENGEKYHEPRALNAPTANGRTIRRQYRNFYRANDDWSFLFNAVRSFQFALLSHHVLAGLEQYNQNQTYRFATAREREAGGTVPSLDLYQPNYGAANPATYTLSAFNTYTAHTRRTGFYAQDEVALNRYVHLLASGRLDRYHDYGFADVTLEYKDVALAGRAGLLVKASENLSFYASGSNSVTRAPIYSQAPSANGPFSPETGHQIEFGAKADVNQRRLSLTTAYFRIDKSNILRTDPAMGPLGTNANAVLATGKARSEGVEFNAEGFLTSRLYSTFNYTYLNTRILQDTTLAAVGQRLANAPRHTVGLFARYNFLRQTGAGLSLEGVTNRIEPYAAIRAGGYFIADVSLYQDFGNRFHLQAQATNVANSTYATASLFAARAGNVPGQPRAFVVTLTVNPFRR